MKSIQLKSGHYFTTTTLVVGQYGPRIQKTETIWFGQFN